MKDGDANFTIAHYNGTSTLWRGLMKSAHHLQDTTNWSVGKGDKVSFWSHKWIDNTDILINHATIDLDSNTKLKKVADYVINGEWKLIALRQCLNEDIVNKILGIQPPRSECDDDFCCWSLTASGKFSSRSMLNFLTDQGV